MKKYIMTALLICSGCAYSYQENDQQRLDRYRSQCMYTYGYQSQDAIAQCVQRMDQQDSMVKAAKDRERNREREREFYLSNKKLEQNLRREEYIETNYKFKKQNEWAQYNQWEKEQEAELKRKEASYIEKYGEANAQPMINLDKASFKLEQSKRRPLM